jgi:hypothetical protein
MHEVEGLSIREIARRSGRDRNTVRSAPRSAEPPRYRRVPRPSKLDPFKEGIGRVAPPGWSLFFKGGWGTGSVRVDHQVALLERNHRGVALAVFTQFDPSHDCGKQTWRGVAVRLQHGLGR